MFSRVWKKALLYSLCTLGLLGSFACSLPLGENPPAAIPPETGFEKQSECLNNLIPGFEQFVDGTAKDAQVIATWNCISDVVTLFDEAVTSSYDDRFTAQALANFVEQNFLNGKKISDATMTEVFRVKQLLVGGAITSISREEMHRFVSVIGQIRDITVRLNPYMKVYSFHWKLDGEAILEGDIKYFESANLEMQQAVKDLAAIIERNGQAYCIDNFVNLMKELSQFGSTTWTWLDGLEHAMPLVHKLKLTLTGGDEANILPSEWRRFGLLSGRGYIQYLRYYYFLKPTDSLGHGPALAYFTRSIDDLFSYLGDMVESKPGQTLTRLEVLDIVQAVSHFFPKVKISDAFLIEVMKVKVVLFGGKIDSFQKVDFELARKKLEIFRALAEKFLNYANVYALSWKMAEATPEESMEYFRKAEANLTPIGVELGSIMETSYDLKALIQLAKEYDLLYPRLEKEPSYGDLAQKYIPILIAGKNIIFSDTDSLVGKSHSMDSVQKQKESHSQWSDFLDYGAQMYSRYSYYYYFLRSKDKLHGMGVEDLGDLVRDSFAILDKLLVRKPLKQISMDEFSRLWSAVKGAEILPEKITLGTLNRLTAVALDRWLLDPNKRLAGEHRNGLDADGLNQLRREFGIWLSSQRFISKIYAGAAMERGKMGAQILAALNADPIASSEALQELKLVYNVPVPLSFDQVGRLHLGQPEVPYLVKTSDMINLVRAAVRLIVRSYAMDAQRLDPLSGGVKQGETSVLFSDVRPLMVELDLLDPRNAKFMDNRFRDASLFTPWSNGDDILDFKEGNDLVLMVLSGVEIDSLLYEQAEKACPITKPTQYKDDWTMELDCVNKVYQEQLPDKFASMPTLDKFMFNLSPESYQDVFLNLLKTAGYSPVAEGTIRMGDLALFPQVSQYVETVFQKYDTNGDGILNTQEALRAYPTFRGILKTAANGQVSSEKQLRGLFAWLLKNAKPPSTTLEKLQFLLWCNKDDDGWNIGADRQKLIKILGFIADSIPRGPNDH